MGNTKAVLLAAVLGATPVLAMDNNSPDGWITTKTKMSLLTKGDIKGSAIHVDTIDGNVTLYGKVRDSAEKQRAEAATKEIKGVKGVRNLLQIVPESQEKTIARSDADIKDQAQKMLKEDPALKDASVSVKSVDKGVVLLAGSTKTFSDHLRAVADVDQIAGVRRVVTEIKGPDTYGYDERVMMIPTGTAEKPATAQAKDSLTDTRITTAVKMRLIGASDVPAMDINVDTTDTVVTLFGAVPNDLAKEKAESEAAKVSGVTRVQNQLEVVPKSEKKFTAAKDDAILSNLKDTFKKYDDYKDVKLEVKNGVVRLTGQVPSSWHKLEAMRMARMANGVRGLQEDLTITPREQPANSKQF